MKRILVLIFLVFSFSFVFAQESRISTEMELFTKELKIEDSQRAKLSKIIIRKYSDLEAISELEKTDESAFRAKRRAVYSGAENSIKMLLSKEQLAHWKTYKAKARTENAKRIKSLRAENASKDDLLDAQYGINQ